MVYSEPTHGWTRAQKFHEHSPSKEPMGSTRKVYQKAISVTYKISQERNWSKQQRDGLFQLQIRISFPFLLAKDSRRFLFIMITRSFFTLLYLGGTYARLVYTWYKKILHDCSTDGISCSKWKQGICWKKYQNETAKIQREETVTVSDVIAGIINTQKNKTRIWHQQDRDEIFEASH